MVISKELIQNLQLGLKDVNKKERKSFEKILNKNKVEDDLKEKLLTAYDKNGITLIDTFGKLMVNINNTRLMKRVLRSLGEDDLEIGQ